MDTLCGVGTSEATCGTALLTRAAYNEKPSGYVCLSACTRIQLTAFYEERPAVARCERTVEIVYVTECMRETGDEVRPFL
jgi:hypothetical protein